EATRKGGAPDGAGVWGRSTRWWRFGRGGGGVGVGSEEQGAWGRVCGRLGVEAFQDDRRPRPGRRGLRSSRGRRGSDGRLGLGGPAHPYLDAFGGRGDLHVVGEAGDDGQAQLRGALAGEAVLELLRVRGSGEA